MPERVPAYLQSIANQSALNYSGQMFDLGNGNVRSQHGLLVVASANTTGGVVTLLGSLDALSWFTTPVTVTTSAPGVLYSATPTATPVIFRFLIAKITTGITGGGTGVAPAASSGLRGRASGLAPRATSRSLTERW